MELFTLVNGFAKNGMEKESNSGQMDLFTKVIGKTIKLMVKED